MNLSPNFTLEELTFSSTAVRLGIDNTPPSDIVGAMHELAAGLERVRFILGYPMHIDSGYRCQPLNKAVGGVPTSAHTTGYAADFTCPAYGTPLEVVVEISKSNILFDQLIQEGTWVHLSVAPTMRQQILTAHFVDGKATYQEGIETS